MPDKEKLRKTCLEKSDIGISHQCPKSRESCEVQEPQRISLAKGFVEQDLASSDLHRTWSFLGPTAE